MNYSYLAGVLDSDGSFSIARRHLKRSNVNYIAMVQLSWKYSDLAEQFFQRLVSEFGGSYARCESTNTRKSYPGHKPYLKFSATGQAAENIARAVLPFLHLKKQQAKNVIILRANTWKGPSRPNSVSESLYDLYRFNKSLNTKNGWKNDEDHLRRS